MIWHKKLPARFNEHWKCTRCQWLDVMYANQTLALTKNRTPDKTLEINLMLSMAGRQFRQIEDATKWMDCTTNDWTDEWLDR